VTKTIDIGFDFRKMKREKTDLEMTGDNSFLKKYIGCGCEAFLRKIRHHIEQIKLLPEPYNITDEKKLNAKQQLENPGKRYILLTRYLTTGT